MTILLSILFLLLNIGIKNFPYLTFIDIDGKSFSILSHVTETNGEELKICDFTDNRDIKRILMIFMFKINKILISLLKI